MTADPYITDNAGDEAWHEIEALVDDLAGRARSETSAQAFYTELLGRTVQTLAAAAGAVWLVGRENQLQLKYQINLGELALDDPDVQEAHDQLIQSAVRQDCCVLFPPHSGGDGQVVVNPTDYLLLFCPLKVDEELVGVLEVVQRPTSHPATLRGNQRLIAMVGELAGDFHRQQRLRDYRERADWADRLDQFSARAHAHLRLVPTAFEIANEGRQLIGCDRVTVLAPRGSRQRVVAISGTDTFDPRAAAVRSLEQLVHRVVRAGEPLWHDGDWSDLPPQLETALREYVDLAHVQTLAVLPLARTETHDKSPGDSPGRPVGCLVIERFDADFDSQQRSRVVAVARHSIAALGNALEYQTLPLLPVIRALRGVTWLFGGERLPRTVLAIAAALLALVALALIPAEYRVASRGELEPQRQRIIYAPSDADVRRVLVTHNQTVVANQPLLELHSFQLDLQMEGVRSERETARAKMTSLGVDRVLDRDDPDRDDIRSRLSAEQQLAVQIEQSHARQEEILDAQQRELLLKSPIAGRVLTWEIDKLLEQGRPLVRGQVLMRVADESGPWVLKLRVGDHAMGAVLDARRKLSPDLRVTFVLGNDPGTRYEGVVREVARTTSVDEDGRPVGLVTVAVDRDLIRHLRPGAAVVARIHVGRRSIGYVWFHDLIDVVRTRVFFYLF